MFHLPCITLLNRVNVAASRTIHDSQNALLISRVEANRVLVRWLAAAVAVLAASAIALWWGRV